MGGIECTFMCLNSVGVGTTRTEAKGGRSSRPFLSSDASCLPRGKQTIDEAIERVGAPAISDYSYEPCRGGAAGYWGWQRTLSSSFTALPILSIKPSCR